MDVFKSLGFWDEFEVDTSVNSPVSGIKRLACALIIRAVLDSRGELSGTFPKKSKQNPRETVRSSIEWLIRSTSDEPPSFYWCCDLLNIDPEAFRTKIKTLPEEDGVKRFFYSRGGVRIYEKPPRTP